MKLFETSDAEDWFSWDAIDGKVAKGLAKQLRKEVGPDHKLFTQVNKLVVFARDSASDDILAANPDDDHAYLIHLTWTEKTNHHSGYPAASRISKDVLPDKFK